LEKGGFVKYYIIEIGALVCLYSV